MIRSKRLAQNNKEKKKNKKKRDMARIRIRIWSAFLVLVMLIVLFHGRDERKYSDMECYEDYKEVMKMDEECKNEILRRGFYLDSDGVIHEDKEYEEIVQEVLNKKGRR